MAGSELQTTSNVASLEDFRSDNKMKLLDKSDQQQQAMMQSLEVLEERSNEDNSPQIKQIKAGYYGRNILSTDTNFINTDRNGITARRQSLTNSMITLNQITLSNQKEQIQRVESFKLVAEPALPPQKVDLSEAFGLSLQIV